MDSNNHLVTVEWIKQHRTKRGGWTKAQLVAIGEGWPPRKGWVDRLEGELISLQQAIEFEEGRDIRLVKTIRKSTNDIKEALDLLPKKKLLAINAYICTLINQED